MKYNDNFMTAKQILKFIDVVRRRLWQRPGFDTQLVIAENYEYNIRKVKMISTPPDQYARKGEIQDIRRLQSPAVEHVI